jgi:NADH-quinone oxidoreductase subunit G
MPTHSGLNAAQMLSGGLKAVLLLNNEPEFDSSVGRAAVKGLGTCQMVVTMSPFKANMEFSDVLLPIAPFTETPGTFVNAEGRIQGFHAVVKPLGDTRPAWKVLRVLANLLSLPGFDFESTSDVLKSLLDSQTADSTSVSTDRLCNTSLGEVDLTATTSEPVVASIYALDGIVRRAVSLQLTADAASSNASHGVEA